MIPGQEKLGVTEESLTAAHMARYLERLHNGFCPCCENPNRRLDADDYCTNPACELSVRIPDDLSKAS